MTMRFRVTHAPRQRELAQIHRRIAQLRTEIDVIASATHTAADGADEPGIYAGVQRMRESIRQDTLQAHQAELAYLLGRVEQSGRSGTAWLPVGACIVVGLLGIVLLVG